MITYTVAVESTGISADWVDDVIVLAPARNVAESLAKGFIREQHPLRDVGFAHALPLSTGVARVVGRLRAIEE
jgi:hypothetical protein